MKMEDRFINFFKKQGINNRKLAKITGHSEQMVGRYLRRPNFDFLSAVIENFPEIDLNYIFKDSIPLEGIVNEGEAVYAVDNFKLIKIIESATNKLKENLAQ